jgi:hypothetical protein
MIRPTSQASAGSWAERATDSPISQCSLLFTGVRIGEHAPDQAPLQRLELLLLLVVVRGG